MPRRNRPERRHPLPDPVYGSESVAKFVNCIMFGGKKSVAERVVYGAFDRINLQTKRDPVEVFDQAMSNAMPVVEVKPKRVGGATYQVPIEIRAERRQALARRWLVHFSRQRNGKSMADKLALELMDAANGQGATIRRREETHRMAESNKAFSHFRY